MLCRHQVVDLLVLMNSQYLQKILSYISNYRQFC